MDLPEVEIKLLRAPNDPAEDDLAVRDNVDAFGAALRAAEVSYSWRSMTFDSATGGGYSPAVFLIATLGPATIGAIGVAAREWIKGRAYPQSAVADRH